MKKKHQRIQLFLILSGLLLILITYFYYPSAITQKKSEKYLPTDENIVKSEPEDWEKNYTTFENVKYEDIVFENMMMFADPEESDLFLSKFTQTARTTDGSLKNNKRLYWRLSSNQWYIVSEDST